jgi:ubiquinone/menaquinone biosynthesis C-methylase UbiE
MAAYWDARAREDPFFFVDNEMRYRNPDVDGFWEHGQEALDNILDQLEVSIRPTDDVLEIGCGLGRITRVLAAQGATVQALDVSARMLERARELNPQLGNVEWILGDGRSLSGIEDSSVDVVHSHVVFQHIPDPDVTLGYVREMGRVLRPGGWAGFHVSNDPSVHLGRGRSSLQSRRDWLRNKVLSVFGRAPRGQSNRAWLGSAVDLELLEAAADGAGMDTERVVGAGTQWCLVLLRAR